LFDYAVNLKEVQFLFLLEVSCEVLYVFCVDHKEIDCLLNFLWRKEFIHLGLGLLVRQQQGNCLLDELSREVATQ
jgi:hypothetical protein